MTRDFSSDINSFINHVKQLEGIVVISTHKNADLDGYGAALGLRKVIEELNINNAEIHIVFHSLNLVATSVIKEFNLDIIRTERQFYRAIFLNTEKKIHFFLVDCNIPSTTGYQEIERASIFNTKSIVDHHAFHPTGEKFSDYYICEPDFSSASEIILNLLLQQKIPIDKKLATALLSGIISDTRRFMESDSELFWSVAELLNEVTVDYRRIIKSLQIEASRSDKIARLKAAQRLIFREIHGFLVVSTFISAYEASAARGLLFLGADFVFVVANTRYETRISFRASSQFAKALNINLGKDVAEVIGRQYHGTGSGHRLAAGVNIPDLLDERKLASEIENFIEAMIESRLAKS
ncbi:MAG: bifunctional oligoribonuclease/PAP phosphatase NrnA [Candidatus Odinarchaeota archaeon]